MRAPPLTTTSSAGWRPLSPRCSCSCGVAMANGWPRPGGLPVPTRHNSQWAFGNSLVRTSGEGPLFHPPKGAARAHWHPRGQGSSPSLQRGQPEHARAAETSGKLGKTPAGSSLLSPSPSTVAINKVYCSCSTCHFGTEGIQGSGNMKSSGASQAAVCRLAEHALREKWESWSGRERASMALRCPAGAHVPGGGPRIPAGCPCPGEVPRGCPCHVSGGVLILAVVTARGQRQVLHQSHPVPALAAAQSGEERPTKA